MDKSEFLDRLAAVVQKHLGPVVIENARQLTGGAQSATWRFDVIGASGRRTLISRGSETVEQISTGLSKPVEAEIQQAAWSVGVPVAEVLFTLAPEDQLGEGYIMACIDGESIPRRILRDERFQTVREELAAQCGRVLGQIHSIQAPESLPILNCEQQLAALEKQFRDYDYAVPAFELAFRWLKNNMPVLGNSGVVHGDFRNGNFLVTAERGINGVLDWELAHVGDPMEDLGWLCVNSWRFGNRNLPVGGFGTRDDLFRAYEAATGTPVDADRVRFWELFGVLKWGVICLYMCCTDLNSGVRSVERAAIGRRISEVETDLLAMLTGRAV